MSAGKPAMTVTDRLAALAGGVPVRPVIAPNDRVHGDDGRAIHLIRTDGPNAYQHALERPICRRGRGPTIWDPANMWDLDERTMCPECARRAARSL